MDLADPKHLAVHLLASTVLHNQLSYRFNTSSVDCKKVFMLNTAEIILTGHFFIKANIMITANGQLM